MITKSIPSSWLIEEEHRLDCGPFVKGSVEARKTIEALSYPKNPLVELTKNGINGIYHVGQDKINWVDDEEHGLPFVRSSDILKADLTNQPLISKKQVSNNRLFQCPEGSTLITRSGSIGRMVYVRSDMVHMAYSQDNLKVVPDKNRIQPGYLYIFLNCKYGLPIITGGTFGSIIVHIEAQNIIDLPVPRLGAIEDESHLLVEKASHLLSEYQNKIKEATQLYFDSVGLSDITASEWHSWGSDLGFSTTGKVQTLRALNYNPRFNRLCERIKQGPWKTLGELCLQGTLKRGSRFKRIDASVDFGYKLIGQKELFWLWPMGRSIAKKYVPDDALVEQGSIMVAARGTLGEKELYCRAEFITGKSTENAYSEDILRIISNESLMERGALFAFIRSETAFRMFRSISIGSKLQDHHYTMLPSLPIPYPPEDIRNRCNQLTTEAYASREKAIELEDQARTLVENAIQEGAR